MIRVIIFIGILFSPLLANATNKSLSNDLAVEAIKIAENIGLPVVVRPSYVLGGRAMEIVHDKSHLHSIGKFYPQLPKPLLSFLFNKV